MCEAKDLWGGCRAPRSHRAVRLRRAVRCSRPLRSLRSPRSPNYSPQMAAAPKIKTTTIDGWLVEEMAPNGYEFAIGGVNDPSFGPMILLAVGGIFIEVFEDIALRICPITEIDAREMISEINFGKIIK